MRQSRNARRHISKMTMPRAALIWSVCGGSVLASLCSESPPLTHDLNPTSLTPSGDVPHRVSPGLGADTKTDTNRVKKGYIG